MRYISLNTPSWATEFYLNFWNQTTQQNVPLWTTWSFKTTAGGSHFYSVPNPQLMTCWPNNSTGASTVKCIPSSSPQNKKLHLNHSVSSGEAQSHLFPLGGELPLQSEQASAPPRLRQILTPSRSRENPCSGKEQPYCPPPLSLFF